MNYHSSNVSQQDAMSLKHLEERDIDNESDEEIKEPDSSRELSLVPKTALRLDLGSLS